MRWVIARAPPWRSESAFSWRRRARGERRRGLRRTANVHEASPGENATAAHPAMRPTQLSIACSPSGPTVEPATFPPARTNVIVGQTTTAYSFATAPSWS